jgi:hypothetical protein
MTMKASLLGGDNPFGFGNGNLWGGSGLFFFLTIVPFAFVEPRAINWTFRLQNRTRIEDPKIK